MAAYDLRIEDFQDPEWRSGGIDPDRRLYLLQCLLMRYNERPGTVNHQSVVALLKLPRYRLLREAFVRLVKSRNPTLATLLERELASN